MNNEISSKVQVSDLTECLRIRSEELAAITRERDVLAKRLEIRPSNVPSFICDDIWTLLGIAPGENSTGFALQVHIENLIRDLAEARERLAEAKSIALLELADELEKKKDAFVHENFSCDPTTGVWEGGTRQEDWVAEQEELIEEIQTRANAITNK